MPRLSTNECKEQIRLNIIKHRQTILKYLENTNDEELKSKIVVNHYKYIKKCNLNISEQKSKLNEVKKKVNVESSDTPSENSAIYTTDTPSENSASYTIDTPSENSDGYLSIGSYEESKSNCSTSDDLDGAKARRKPKCLKLSEHKNRKKMNNKRKMNCKYIFYID